MDKIELAKWIVDHHFGLNVDGVSRCSTCDDTPWPCHPARLADLVRIEELAK